MNQRTAGLLSLAAFGALGYLLFSTAHRTSLVYDEVIYAPAGAMIWKTGDFRWNSEHPPLQKLISALSLLAAGVDVPEGLDPDRVDAWRMGYRVFFLNRAPAPVLIFLARLPTIVLTLLLGLVLFVWVKNRAGWPAGVVSLAAFAFDPLVLGNGALAMNDMFVTFFVFSAALAFRKWIDDGCRWPWGLLSGALAGAAMVSKFSGILVLPVFAFLYWQARPRDRAKGLLRLAGAGGAALAVALLCYRFDFGFLLRAVRTAEALHVGDHGMGYLLGPIPGASGWFYYPVASLIKTPIPLLVLWIAALIFLFKKGAPSIKATLLGPVLLFWLAALISRNHFGLRYLLPATPFLAAAAGLFYASLPFRYERFACAGLLLWLAIEAMVFHPHHMAYFNELIGGPKNGWKWLDGSNQDWGQDLPALARLVQKQDPQPTLCLGYWGSNQPEAWGLRYQDVVSPAITNAFRPETVNSAETEREWLVVSAELLHNPATRNVYAWLKHKKPIAFPGSTLFVYDITRDKDSVHRMAALYQEMGRKNLVERQMERARLIDKASNR